MLATPSDDIVAIGIADAAVANTPPDNAAAASINLIVLIGAFLRRRSALDAESVLDYGWTSAVR
jgi:hypothetical protein